MISKRQEITTKKREKIKIFFTELSSRVVFEATSTPTPVDDDFATPTPTPASQNFRFSQRPDSTSVERIPRHVLKTKHPGTHGLSSHLIKVSFWMQFQRPEGISPNHVAPMTNPLKWCAHAATIITKPHCVSINISSPYLW